MRTLRYYLLVNSCSDIVLFGIKTSAITSDLMDFEGRYNGYLVQWLELLVSTIIIILVLEVIRRGLIRLDDQRPRRHRLQDAREPITFRIIHLE
ncbi:hypothetical protein AFLA_012002 [Aspergillus flavus NRRL3357]|nr:hypothetical protein AFLA_012002 [Aspergillus flavus NRRL3357]